jgi:hypothetical protein
VFSFWFFAVFSLPVKPQTAEPTGPRTRPSGRAAQDAGYAYGSFLPSVPWPYISFRRSADCPAPVHGGTPKTEPPRRIGQGNLPGNLHIHQCPGRAAGTGPARVTVTGRAPSVRIEGRTRPARRAGERESAVQQQSAATTPHQPNHGRPARACWPAAPTPSDRLASRW